LFWGLSLFGLSDNILILFGKLPGDVDGNGKVELADAILALKIMAGITISAPQTVGFFSLLLHICSLRLQCVRM